MSVERGAWSVERGIWNMRHEVKGLKGAIGVRPLHR
jgi:hypothetical protein